MQASRKWTEISDIQKFRMEAVGSVHAEEWKCICDCMKKLEQY
jgi:hypothetical protein